MEQQDTVEPSKPRLKVVDKTLSESHREYLDMDTDEEEFGHQETPEPQDEAPPEPDKPMFTASELNTLVNYTKELTVLPSLSETDWNDDCLDVIREYFSDPTKTILTVYFFKNRLNARLDFPHETDNGLAYFLRDPWQVYNTENFMSQVIFGTITERIERTALKFAEGVYAPVAFKNDHWPEIMKDEIFTNLNDFLTQATDVTYKPLGMLILYVPWEETRIKQQKQCPEIEGESEARIKFQKEQVLLINRLERVARNWTRQIREVLNKTLPVSSGQLHDITSEFDFWKSRHGNLACISRQLGNDRLLSIVKQLNRVRSPSVGDLRLLVTKVENALEEATSNLTYLDIILENCKNIFKPDDVQNCMPKILHVFRFTWTESPYYNKSKNIERLLCSLSVHLINVCTSATDLKLIFEDPKKCREILGTNLSCCSFYSKIYDSIIANILANHNEWTVRKDNVFNFIHSFEQRCRDLIEICDAIIIYNGLNKINLGGTKVNKREIQYRHAKDHFSQIVSEMRVRCDYALDIQSIRWFQDMSKFRSILADLENTMKNLFNGLFEDANNVEMAIETLYTLLKFKERKCFQNIFYEKWTKVWKMFFDEVKLRPSSPVENEMILNQIKFSVLEDIKTSSDINKNYVKRLFKMMINASDWIGDCDIQFEILTYLRTYLQRQSVTN